MELQRYLRLIAHRWWVVVATTVVATLGTLLIVAPQPSIYEATGTMVIKPRPVAVGDNIDAADVLVRGVKVGATYANVAKSELIRTRAEERLGDALDTSDLSVSADMVTDTFILEIAVSGPYPRAAQALAASIQREMVTYAASFGNTYALVPLDTPDLPTSPIGPNKKLAVAVGMVLGLLAGIGLVLLEQYLRGPEASPLARVVDPGTGLRTATYVGRRLAEEAARAGRTRRGFAFVVLRMERRYGDHDEILTTPPVKEIRRIGRALGPIGSPEAVVAHLGGGLFVALLPDMGSDDAKALLGAWTTVVRVQAGRDAASAARVRTVTASCLFVVDVFAGDQEAIEIATELMNGGPGTGGSRSMRESSMAVSLSDDPTPGWDGDRVQVDEPPVADALTGGTGPRDPRGDARRRRGAWKGNSRAGNRSG